MRSHRLGLLGVLALACTPWLQAAASNGQPAEGLATVSGTIVNVEKKEVTSPNQCCYNPTDAPLQTRYFAYQVSVKVDCETYVGHYESPYDYLPSELTPNRPVEVRLAKHEMTFDLPGDREMKMPIVHREVDRGSPCGPSTASR